MKKKIKKVWWIATRVGNKPVKVSFYDDKGKKVTFKAYKTYLIKSKIN